MNRRIAIFGLIALALWLSDDAEARRRGRRSAWRARRPRRSAGPRSSGSQQSYLGGTYYRNCSHARAAGAAPVRRGDPGYRAALDRDNDGVGCE